MCCRSSTVMGTRRLHRFRPSHDSTEIALANFALTFAKALLVFCVVLFMLINPKQGDDGTKPKAEFLITLDWSGDGKYDVDTWMRLPNGSRVNFQNKESGVVFLERDDLGNTCDQTTTGGRPVNACEEITAIRGVVAGEYVLALHLYSAFGSTAVATVAPVTVHIKIEKLNPTVRVIWQTITTLDKVRAEKGVVRFTIMRDGSVGEFETDELPRLIYQ